MQETAAYRPPRTPVPQAPTVQAPTSTSEVLMGLLFTLGSGVFYFAWKGQAGLWRAATFSAIGYLVVLVVAVACQQELLRLPWAGLQQHAAAFLSLLAAVASLGHFDFTAGTIAYNCGALYLAGVMLYRLKQRHGLRNLALRNALRSLTNLIVLLGGAVSLVGLYFPWQDAHSYQILVNNKMTPIGEVDPRFLAAMHMTYVPRTAFAAGWALPVAGAALGMLVWALFQRTPRTPAWYHQTPLVVASALTLWGLLGLNKNPGPYVFGAGVAVLVIGGLMAGIRGQLEAVKHRYRVGG